MSESTIKLKATNEEDLINKVQSGAKKFINLNANERQKYDGAFIEIELWDGRKMTATPRNLGLVKLNDNESIVFMDHESCDVAINAAIICMLEKMQESKFLVTELQYSDPNTSLVWQITSPSN